MGGGLNSGRYGSTVLGLPSFKDGGVAQSVDLKLGFTSLQQNKVQPTTPGGGLGLGMGSHLTNNNKLSLNMDDDSSLKDKNIMNTPSSKNDDNDLVHNGSDNEN